MTLDVKLREADERECIAGGFPSGEAALRHSIAHSDCAFTVQCDGEVLCYWGYRAINALTGGCVAWMLSTPAIERNPVFAARQSRRLLTWLLHTFGDVYVSVDEEYAVSVKWLTWLGFYPIDREGRMVQMRAVLKRIMN